MPTAHNGKHVHWYLSSDNTIYVEGLILETSASYEDGDATVSGQLKTTAGASVGSAITFAYVSSSNGNFRGILTDTVAATLTAGTTYYMDLTCTAQTGEVLTIRLQGPAVYAGA